VIWGTKSLTSAFKGGEPIATVILVIVVLLCLVLLLRQINLPRVLTRGQTSAVPRSVPR
jgi:glycerol-3-phosphate acyltransferase PlsY